MKTIVILLTTLLTMTANAQRNHRSMQKNKLVLQIHDHLRGSNIIKLKQEIKYQHPMVNVQRLKLKAVKLVAKSKKGMGKATLIVGHDMSYPINVNGSPYEFHNDSGYTYDKLKIQNPSYSSKGKWQIELKGNIKVKKLVLIVEKNQKRQQIVKIDMYDQQLKGFNVLKLKKLIKQQKPGIDLQTMQLKKVVMQAKSKMGKGQATLVTGQTSSYPETVGGSPRAFHSYSQRSYDLVTLKPDSMSTNGKWQVELQGNIKVKSITVVMIKKKQNFYY